MTVKVTNNGFSTLASGINNSVTTIALASGEGARFPNPSSPDVFYATLIDTSNNLEVVKVTARSTDSLTVVRAQDNTSARAFSTGDRFELRPVAKLFEDIQAEARDLNGAELVLDADGDTSITADTDDRIDMKVGGADVAHIINTGVSQGALLNRNPQPIIINGDMAVAQRGNQTGKTDGCYTACDRFYFNSINMGTWSLTQSTENPGFGFAHSLKYDCTSADGGVGAGDNNYLSYQTEGRNLQGLQKGTSNAKTSTVAFWIKCNKTGNIVCELWDRTNDRHVGQVVSISSADTWEKKIVNFPADTSGAIASDNARSIMISWAFGAGSNFTSGTLPSAWASRSDANRFVGTTLSLPDNTANEVYITGVQWEIGTFTADTIPPFQFEDAQQSLSRCHRYYFRQGDEGGYAALGSGVCENTAQAYIMINLPTTMRASPSASFTGNVTLFDGDTFNTSSSINSTQKGTNCVRLTVTGNIQVANGHGATLHVENSSSYAEFASEI